jgi:hypothetical protein
MAMKSAPNDERPTLRVWIVVAEDWRPTTAFDVPPAATALFPAADRCMTAHEAAHFIAGFNEQMLVHSVGASGAVLERRWAVARRVELRFDGDFEPGEQLSADAFALAGQ